MDFFFLANFYRLLIKAIFHNKISFKIIFQYTYDKSHDGYKFQNIKSHNVNTQNIYDSNFIIIYMIGLNDFLKKFS